MYKSLDDLKNKIKSLEETQNGESKLTILVSMGTCGIAAGTAPILEKIREEVAETDRKIEINVDNF